VPCYCDMRVLPRLDVDVSLLEKEGKHGVFCKGGSAAEGKDLEVSKMRPFI
jgi:hypothetical protein